MIDIHTIGIGADTSQIRTANKDLDRFEQNAGKSSRAADGLTGSITTMAKGFLGVTAGIAAFSKLTSTLDEYTKYTAILKNATSGQNEFNAALSDIRRIANTAQTDVAGLATTYARFSNALKEYGATQKQVSTLTETVALALKANGASAMETSSAMLQLSQAFGAGRLSGDEFRSMAEAAPNLMRALAASIGVPTGSLKEMAAQGQLTNDVLLKAFTDPKLTASLQSQAEQITTFTGALQKLTNEVSALFSTAGQQSGFIELITNAIGSLATAIRELNEVLSKGKISFDSWLPAYERFRATMDKQSQSQFKFATTIGQSIGEGGFEGLKNQQKTLSIMTDAEIAAADKAAKEINKIKEKALKDSLAKERELRDAESAWRARRDNDYQDELKKQWDANQKDKEKKAEKFAEHQLKLEQELNGQIRKFNDMQDDAQYAAIKRRAEAYRREYDRIGETVSRSLTDALLRGFESGKSFAENFIDTLKNMFATLVLRPAIEFILNGSGITGALAGLGGLFSGNAGAATSGTSQGVSLIKGIVNGFDGLNSTFQSSIESLGSYLAESNFGAIKSLGGIIGQYSSQIANIAPFAGAALQLLSGNVRGAAFTGAGTALGSFFAGPVGGAIGGALGGALGSLFGGRVRTQRSSTGVTGLLSNGVFTSSNQSGIAGYNRSLGGSDALANVLKNYSTVINGLFESFGMGGDVNTSASLFQRQSRKTRAWGYFSANAGGGSVGFSSSQPFGSAQAALEDLVNRILTEGITTLVGTSNLPEGIRMLFAGLADKESVQAMVQASMQIGDAQDALIKRFGLTADAAGKVAIQSGLAGTELAQFASLLAQSALATQKSSVTLIKERNALNDLIGSLPTSIDAFDAILKSINTATADGQSQFAELFQLRERFANYTSSFDTVVSNVESAIYGMLSPSEKLALDQANLAKAFGELNLSVPGSIQELIDLGKSIDYATESGLDLALAFPALVDMFGKTQEAVNSLTADLSANYFSTLADFRSAQVSNSPSNFIKNQAQINSDLLAEIQAMKEDGAQQKAVLLTVAEYTFKQSRVLDDWDANGMPAVRTE